MVPLYNDPGIALDCKYSGDPQFIIYYELKVQPITRKLYLRLWGRYKIEPKGKVNLGFLHLYETYKIYVDEGRLIDFISDALYRFTELYPEV
jgi:hypothetical protein